jgi:hypothetical protein
MTRCNSCNSVITRSDAECYICNEPVPGLAKPFWRRKPEPSAKPVAPVTPVSNLLFMGSLVLTGICFFTHQIPLPVSLALSGILLAARFVTDRSAAPRRVPIPIAPPKSSQVPPALLRRMTLG